MQRNVRDSEVNQALLRAPSFGSRPGHKWEFSGYVSKLPPVNDDEKRVSVVEGMVGWTV